MDGISDIQEFYRGQSILLTGATGFLGKIITEKLLRTCPEIKRLFLLIRTRKEKDSQQRINELFDDPVFGLMKKENPEYMKKIYLIAGDVSQPDIGISESDRKMLTDEVTIVFHGAATVRFDEKLKIAVNININGTRQLLQLCSEFLNLKALVHISTAYSNCIDREVKELIYKPPICADDIIKVARCLPDNELDILTSKIIQDWPNTYAFTKQIAEDLVKSEAISKKIPTAIFRPAIVISAYSEPIPGWINNLYNLVGVTAAAGAGLLRTVVSNVQLRTDVVPVDKVVNATLAIAWDLNNSLSNGAKDSTQIDPVAVYNYATSKRNRLIWADYHKYLMQSGWKFPLSKAVWYTTLTTIKYPSIFFLFSLLVHLLPAMIVDLLLLIVGKKPQVLQIYRKLHKFILVLSYFGTNEWNFHVDNVEKLWRRLSEKDKELFNFDMDALDWELYFENSIKYGRIFLLGDPLDTLPTARRRMAMFGLLHRGLQAILFLIIVWIFRSPALKLMDWMANIIMNDEFK